MLEQVCSREMSINTFSEKFSDFIYRTTYEDIGSDVRDEARRVFVNAVCTMIAGAEDPSIRKFLEALSPLMGPKEAIAFGFDAQVDVPSAAFLNAASGNVMDYDDTHLQTLIHLGSVIFSATTALAQIRPVSGKQLLLAYIVAAEVETRLGLALGPGHYPGGWHITATCGTIGAAAACSKLLDLDARQTAHAIGIAVNMSGGVIENLQSMAKSIGVGDAARGGLLAALYAKAGVDSASTALEGPLGFFSVYSRKPQLEGLFDELGTSWRFMESSCKPYASCVLLFPVIDAILDIRRKHNIDVDSIDQVYVRGVPLLVRLHTYPISTPREAKLCLQHGAAVTIIRGTAGIDDFLEGAINDPAVRKLADKVVAEEDESYDAVSASVTITMKDATKYTSKIEYCKGSAENPVDDDGLKEKCRAILNRRISSSQSEKLIDTLWQIETAKDVADVVGSVKTQLS